MCFIESVLIIAFSEFHFNTSPQESVADSLTFQLMHLTLH